MGEAKPAAKIEATLGHYGKHYYLKSETYLQGRGITFIKRYESSDLTPQAQHRVGWFEYKVTERAFETLCRKYPVVTESLL